jgi:hypothetical protein
MHIYWKMKTFVSRLTVTQLTLLTHHTVDCQYRLLTYCTSCPQVYGGFYWVTTNSHPASILLPTECLHALLFEVIQLLVVETHVSLVLGHSGRRMVLTAWQDCSENVFVSGDYCLDGARSDGHAEKTQVDTKALLLCLVRKHYATYLF